MISHLAFFHIPFSTNSKYLSTNLIAIITPLYQLGVAAELIEPTQPIYNEFPDGAILTTQIVAGVATTALMVMLGVRITKTMIKHNIFNCGSKCNGGDNSFATDEEEISTGYVQA